MTMETSMKRTLRTQPPLRLAAEIPISVGAIRLSWGSAQCVLTQWLIFLDFWFFIGSARAPQQADFGVLRGARADPRKNSLYKLQPKFFLLQFHVLCSESPILLSASLSLSLSLSGFPMKYCISALRLLESHFLVKSHILLLNHVRSYWYHSPDFPWKQTR